MGVKYLSHFVVATPKVHLKSIVDIKKTKKVSLLDIVLLFFFIT